MRVDFAATPRIYRKFHAAELSLLDGIETLEAPDRFAVFERLAKSRPDLVVANLNVANSLEGMGFNVKWSTELTFTPIRGFSGAPALFALFAAAMRRHDALAVGAAGVGTPANPIRLEFFRPERDRQPQHVA
jgi:hypothetical protein